MNMKFQISHLLRLGSTPAPGVTGRASRPVLREAGGCVREIFPCRRCFPRGREKQHPRRVRSPAFSLVEVLVVMTLLSLIVLALMAVFNSTQTAFRASVTQADVLEGGRAAADLMASDLRQMSPSLGGSSAFINGFYSQTPVNFYVNTNSSLPLVQSLPGSTAQRVNVLEGFFALGRGNLNGSPAWIGVGYAVYPASQTDLNPLYRFYMTTNVAAASPQTLFTNFTSAVLNDSLTNWSHLLDGVVDLPCTPTTPTASG